MDISAGPGDEIFGGMMQEIMDIFGSLRKQIEAVEMAIEHRKVTSSEVAVAAEFFQIKLMRVVKLAKAERMKENAN